MELDINEAVFTTSGRYMAICEENGQKFYLICGKEKLFESEIEGNITQIKVSRNGYVSIVISNTSYKSIVDVFDKTGKEIEIDTNTIIESTKNSKYFIKIEQNEEQEIYSILNSNLEKITTKNYKYVEYLQDKYFIAISEEGKSGIIDEQENVIIEFKYDLIQTIKGKNIIQARNFESDMTEIYTNELNKILEIKNINIQILDDYSKIYNEEEEYYLDNNGNKIEDEEKLEEIKKSNAILRIGNFKRVTYGVEQYYYIEEN